MWRALLFMGAVALGAIYGRRFRRYEVAGESMAPTLIAGDYLVADQKAFATEQPRRGDIVLVHDPRTPARVLVKRVAAVDGDGRAWVLGDNSGASTDSRTFGWLARDALVGRVVWRYWPAGRMGRPR